MTPKKRKSREPLALDADRREILKLSALTAGGAVLLGGAGLSSAPSSAPAEKAAAKNAARIDVHAHYFPAKYLERMDSYGATGITLVPHRLTVSNQEQKNLDARFAMMERAGIGMQVISCANVFPYFESEEKSVDAARLANDLYADLVRQYPKRFAAFGCTPLPHIDASLKEIRHSLDDLGMAGITIGSFVMGKTIADPMFEAIFAELNRRKAIVFIHPIGGGGGVPLLETTKLIWPIGAPFEDAMTLMQLIQLDYPRRYPDMKVIVPHLGGFAPFLLTRFDQFRDQYMPKDPPPPSVQARNFWYDTVNGSPAALRCSCDVLGTDKLMLGTDFPYWVDDAFQLQVDCLRQARLPAHVENDLYRANAERLLGMKAA